MGAFGSQIMGDAGNFASCLTFALFRSLFRNERLLHPISKTGRHRSHGTARDGLRALFFR